MADHMNGDRHNFTFHTDLIEGCDVCEVEAKVVRFTADREIKDICAPCIREGRVPDGFTVLMWCTDCEATIPIDLRPDCLTERGQ